MIKKVLSVAGCAVGGILIGFFANKLDTAIGIVFFAAGVLLLAVSTYATTRGK